MPIDRDSPIPAYYQILIDLERRITSLEWKVGEAIPSEAELVQYYKVSRVTLRQALEILSTKGVVVRKRGHGTFLNKIPDTIEKEFSNLTKYREKAMHFGMNLEANVLLIEECIDSAIAHLLQVNSKDCLIHIERLFTSNGIPYSLNHSWIPSGMIPGILENGLIDNSLSKTLKEKFDIVPVISDNWIEAVTTDSATENILGVEKDTVLMSITTIEKTEANQAFEYSVTYWIREYIRFHFSHYKAEQTNK